MKVLLTGATGFIGSFLAAALLKKGYEVRALVRTSSNLRWIVDLDVDCHYGSLDNPESLQPALDGVDYVYHLAGTTKALTRDEFFQGNTEATKNLVRAAQASSKKIKRFVFVSSQAAAGPSPNISPIDEQAEPNPLTWYGESKLQAEQYLLSESTKIPFTIIRPPAVYGPRDTDVLQFFKTVKKGLIPKLDGREKYLSLIYVKDLANGIIQAAESKKAKGQTYYLANPRPYSWDTFSKLTLNVLNKKGIRINVPGPLMDGVAFLSERISMITKKSTIVNRQKVIEMKQDFWICNPDKAKKDFKFEAVTNLEDGIRETLSWYLERHWL